MVVDIKSGTAFPEVVAGDTDQVPGILAFFDPLLRRSSAMVKAD